VGLERESTVDVPFIAQPFLTVPIVCGADGKIFVRAATTGGVADLTGISSDGKSVTSFNAGKMDDIVNPSPTTFFIGDSDVYILVRGSKSDGSTLVLRRPDGSTERQQASSSQQFIAHFKDDGTYLGAVSLDLPFRPLQLGVFRDGDFLVTGITTDNQETRVAMVKSNGQFNRFVELKDDIRLRTDSGDDTASPLSLPRTGKRFGEGFSEAVQGSTIIPDGTNLLLIRRGQRTPVFSISPGGQVQSIQLDVPSGYSLWDLKPAHKVWVVLYTHRLAEGAGVEFSSVATDPTTGKSLQSYSYAKFPGFGLACTDGIEFTFLVREDNKLKIVKLTSSRSSPSSD
jgi:hypothetical protein